MAMVTDAGSIRTGFLFNFSEDEYIAEQRLRLVADLQAEVAAGMALMEALQYEALGSIDSDDGTYDYIVRQLPAQLAELERKQRLWQAHRDHPLRPRLSRLNDDFRERIDAVRAAWPIERFCRELLLLNLIPAGAGKFKACCPLPGHDEKTPSFYIDAEKGLWYCHGSCKRGGDVLKLTQYRFNLHRFTDALEKLEREGGVR